MDPSCRLRAGTPFRIAASCAYARFCGTPVRICRISGRHYRVGIHAALGRGNRNVDACYGSQHIVIESNRIVARAGSDYFARSGGRFRRREDRTRGNIYRSGADQHDRNDRHLQTEGPVACGIDEGRDHAAAGRKASHARRYKYLDATHSQPHRHVVHGNSHSSGHQGLWLRFRDDREKVVRDRTCFAPGTRGGRSVCRKNHGCSVP